MEAAQLVKHYKHECQALIECTRMKNYGPRARPWTPMNHPGTLSRWKLLSATNRARPATWKPAPEAARIRHPFNYTRHIRAGGGGFTLVCVCVRVWRWIKSREAAVNTLLKLTTLMHNESLARDERVRGARSGLICLVWYLHACLKRPEVVRSRCFFLCFNRFVFNP